MKFKYSTISFDLLDQKYTSFLCADIIASFSPRFLLVSLVRVYLPLYSEKNPLVSKSKCACTGALAKNDVSSRKNLTMDMPHYVTH